MRRPVDPEAPDPYKELWDKLGEGGQFKRCPECGKPTLRFDARTGTVLCAHCGFRQETQRA